MRGRPPILLYAAEGAEWEDLAEGTDFEGRCAGVPALKKFSQFQLPANGAYT